jgi:rfaE bifunctional protein nucleotidyltransferase chain/domain
MKKLQYESPKFELKIVSSPQSEDAIKNYLKALKAPIVFTNGVFDILHRGHVTYLEQAKSLGSSLIVGINSDQSVKSLGKGDDRPINSQNDRMALIAALASVDLVICFEEQTPVNLINQLRPDIYVKGGDYEIDTLEETKLVKTWGGKAFAIPFIYHSSTSKLLHKIRG